MHVGRCEIVRRVDIKRQMTDIVGDSDREAPSGLLSGHLVEYSHDHGGIEVFARQSVASADHFNVASRLQNGRCNVEQQRFAFRSRLFAAVHHRNASDRCRYRFNQCFGGERAEKPDAYNTGVLPAAIKRFGCLRGHFSSRPHDHYHAVGIWIAVVVKQMISPAGGFGHAVHGTLHNGRKPVIEGIGGFTELKIYVGVLCRAAHVGMIGVHRRSLENGYFLSVDHSGNCVVGDGVDGRNLVARAPSVEEVQHRHSPFYGRKMGHKSEIHHFLHAAGGKHCESSATAGHHVLMIAEYRQGVGGYGAGAYMEHYREKFAGDLIHVGYHQQQSLRGGECRSQSAGRGCAVSGSGRTELALHFLYFHRTPPYI